MIEKGHKPACDTVSTVVREISGYIRTTYNEDFDPT